MRELIRWIRGVLPHRYTPGPVPQRCARCGVAEDVHRHLDAY